MENNIENIVEHLLLRNRIRNYNKKDLKLQLRVHPNFPSFQSITDTLDYFNIDNVAVEVPKSSLEQLPQDFVSIIHTDNGDEIVSVNKKNNRITLENTTLKSNVLDYSNFSSIWVPKVIAVEKEAKSSIISKKPSLFNLLLLITVASFITIFIGKTHSIPSISFFLLSITGLILSFFAVQESLGIQSQTVHQFCSSVGNTNCGDVINSTQGKLFNTISLADMGLLFFGSLVLFQLFFGFNSTLLIPTLISIPVTLYSIYSQAFVLKKWCALCIATILTTAGILAIAMTTLPFQFSYSGIYNLLAISSLFGTFYIFSREKIAENKKAKSENIDLTKFKRDEEIFEYFFKQSKVIEDTTKISNEIILGNPGSKFKIITLTNPMCGYCKEAFEAYARVLKAHGEHLQVTIRFKVSQDSPEDQARQISLRLAEIYHENGAEAFIKAYSDWFKDRTYTAWIKKYSTSINNPDHIRVLKKQAAWAETNDLFYTPASIINHTVYPTKYTYKEFFHFISALKEEHRLVKLTEENLVEV
ncbi:thioredoxin domain-containing protein [Aquimarina sp. TRL1]|uniref:vitamin K epoxide reductase family protein n=1 Tax=Aquimarina sp. (strain TRL1) TaxID=2736252 RepID=UPI00158EC447|nr:vitamin K epoxide reductase family protein [Aquimarina sp. TRL1]QKX05072.1 thioredoxin domain-containing protein [Aquimarina sp. TRL1]